ncbi:MAG TPA: hypothetical protein VGY49_05945 [Burkholderiaceae bacterium]|jgi:hypothetical protein|nr:hypothetical protein [Burkholderiaceae bacterium]
MMAWVRPDSERYSARPIDLNARKESAMTQVPDRVLPFVTVARRAAGQAQKKAPGIPALV